MNVLIYFSVSRLYFQNIAIHASFQGILTQTSLLLKHRVFFYTPIYSHGIRIITFFTENAMDDVITHLMCISNAFQREFAILEHITCNMYQQISNVYHHCLISIKLILSHKLYAYVTTLVIIIVCKTIR